MEHTYRGGESPSYICLLFCDQKDTHGPEIRSQIHVPTMVNYLVHAQGQQLIFKWHLSERKIDGETVAVLLFW